MKADIHFRKTYKGENIISTFTKVKLSIRHGNNSFEIENSFENC